MSLFDRLRGGAEPRGDLASSEPIVLGRALPRGFDEACDVVIVGAGAGGSVCAAILAEAGLSVIALEEGPYYPNATYQRFTPSESLRRMFRESGMVTALGVGQTPLISITMGRVVGGSTVLTGGVCFRIPGELHHRWEHELGLGDMSEAAYEAAYEEVERRLAVREVPVAARSESTNRFVEGAARMGIAMEPIRRNTGHECVGDGLCNFGCPAGAKRSADIAYVPSAVKHGARLVADALVERVIVKDGRAAGIEGRLLGGELGAPSHRFRVRAPIVIAACGTIHTPLVLEAAGVGRRSGLLGKQITLHPAARVVARFDDRLNGWDGALQSCFSDHFADDGIKLTGVYTAVNVLAAGMPGVGKSLRANAEALPYCGVFGTMVHDEGGGTVRRGPGREPVVTYSMIPRDIARLRRGIRILSEAAFAGGAREVYSPIFGQRPIRTVDEALALEKAPLDARRIECMAFHPLGSARAANDPRRGVVDQRGECFELPGLFVADGSVLPTSIGVNSQVAVLSTATKIAWSIRDRARTLSAPARLGW